MHCLIREHDKVFYIREVLREEGKRRGRWVCQGGVGVERFKAEERRSTEWEYQ